MYVFFHDTTKETICFPVILENVIVKSILNIQQNKTVPLYPLQLNSSKQHKSRQLDKVLDIYISQKQLL